MSKLKLRVAKKYKEQIQQVCIFDSNADARKAKDLYDFLLCLDFIDDNEIETAKKIFYLGATQLSFMGINKSGLTIKMGNAPNLSNKKPIRWAINLNCHSTESALNSLKKAEEYGFEGNIDGGGASTSGDRINLYIPSFHKTLNTSMIFLLKRFATSSKNISML